jgi:hypothetical protein
LGFEGCARAKEGSETQEVEIREGRTRQWSGGKNAGETPALRNGFTGVEKEFEVAFGAGEAGREDVENLEAGRGGAGFDGGDGFLVELRVGDDAAFGDVGRGEFELGFDEDEEVGAGGGAGDGGGKNFAKRNEGHISGDEVDALGDVAGRKIAGVAFDGEDEWVLLESPGQLIRVDIRSEHQFCAVLEKAVGEAAGGGAEVEANAAGGVERKVGESGCEFEAGAGSEFLAGGEFEAGIGGDGSAGFVGAEAVEADFAGEDEGLGFFFGVSEAAGDEGDVEAGAPRFGLHGA